MPFRFRRIISLGKGFRLNLSKSGISTSVGKPGASLNIGPRPRVTIGAPGTGLSYSQPIGSARKTSKSQANAIVALVVSFVLICLSIICCIGVLFASNEDPTTEDTRSNPVLLPTDSLSTFISATYSAASTQTRIAEPFTATPFIYNSPMPLATSEHIYNPTTTPIPTNTPFVWVSPTMYASGASDCPCAGDTLSCPDFKTHAEAQACFNKCMAEGMGDIHKLDGNNDGQACESLP